MALVVVRKKVAIFSHRLEHIGFKNCLVRCDECFVVGVGGRPEKIGMSDRDQQICDAIGPLLSEKGQVFVGIDVIGDYLTEINLTSPTGIQELKRFDGTDTAGKIWQVIEAKRGI